jgi:hypothetical protein
VAAVPHLTARTQSLAQYRQALALLALSQYLCITMAKLIILMAIHLCSMQRQLQIKYFHKVVPYGVATGPDHKTQSYATTPAIREAAMIVAVDIWQARQVSQTGGVGMDGVSASPYRMGYQLINRVRGLIQPYSSPASLVG